MGGRVVCVDKIQGDQVVLIVEGTELVVRRSWLPDGTAEGSVLRMNFEADPAEEIRRKTAIDSTLERLGKRSDSGEKSHFDL